MMNDELKTIAAEPPFDPLTDTGKVAQAVKQVIQEQMKIEMAKNNASLVVEIDNLLKEREKVSRSFWRGVYNVCKSGIKQAFAEAEHLFKE